MEQLLKQLLDWATNIKNQTQIEGNSSTIVGGGLEKLIAAITTLQANKADASALAQLSKELQTISIKFKGYHATETALKAAYPATNNKKDDFAWVGSPYPGTVWKVNADGGNWTNTEEKPSLPQVNLGEYVRKVDVINELGDSDTAPIAQKVVTEGLKEKADVSQIVTEETNVKKVSIADDEGHEVATWTEDGTFNTVKLSDNLLKLIDEYINGNGQAKPRFFADVYLIPCYGQSLSINTSAGASTFTDTVSISYDVNLNKTNIQDMCAGTAEMFEIMAHKIGVPLPTNFKMMHCLGGAGGVSISQLSKDTKYYNNVINSVKKAKTTCDAAGLTLNVPAFTWTQGEEDMRAGGNASGYDPTEYKNKLRALIDDFNSDINQ